jgi:ABC transporter substrate binding protein
MGWMAADLIGRRVAVILIGGNTTGERAMIAAIQSIPIVFTTSVDPLAAELVASLNRPGDNATGVTTFASELGPKKIELLNEVVPTAKKIAVLVNPTNRVSLEGDVSGAQMAAHRLGRGGPAVRRPGRLLEHPRCRHACQHAASDRYA